jgi:hypothetical protein
MWEGNARKRVVAEVEENGAPEPGKRVHAEAPGADTAMFDKQTALPADDWRDEAALQAQLETM